MTETGSTVMPAADVWREFARRLGEVGAELHAATDRTRTSDQQSEVNEHLLRTLSAAALYMVQMDPDNPSWLPLLNNVMRSCNPHPDAIYHITSLRSSGVYRFYAKHGAAREVNLQVLTEASGFCDRSVMTSDTDISHLLADKNGQMEIILSSERPEDFSIPWIALDPQSEVSYLLLRQVAFDWSAGEDMKIGIERVDRTPVPWKHSQEAFNQRLLEVPEYVSRMANSIHGLIKTQDEGLVEVNQMFEVTNSFNNLSSFKSQGYAQGRFVVADTDAIIIEIDFPEQCRFWNVQLMDSFYNALDFTFHQSGLNQSTGRIDRDGKVRFVLCRQDPGVANWLDKGDYDVVALRARWMNSPMPGMTTKTVPFSQVLDCLPDGTARMSKDERHASLGERAAAAQLRVRW